jgi:hypothetical protein
MMQEELTHCQIIKNKLSADLNKLPEKNHTHDIRKKRNVIESELQGVNNKISGLRVELKKLNVLRPAV